MAMTPEQYARFDRNVELKTLMAVVVDRLGRDAADSVAEEALEVVEGRRQAPNVVWPRF